MISIINFLLFAADVAPDAVPGTTDSPVTPSLEMLPGYEGAFLKMFLALIALIVGIFFTVWLLKKLARGGSHGNSGRSIKVVEKRPLSPKTMLYIIDVDGQQSVIAESQLEVKHLMNLEEFKDSEAPKA